MVVGSSALVESIVGAGVVAGRSVMETGKWPVWKVLLCRRRWPERDLGSACCICISFIYEMERGGGMKTYLRD